jgi:nitroimidazol reductase NimA-like FMN-containing flavoprotein (pyridoxamine 5'-phosphate oxidase superfamily)
MSRRTERGPRTTLSRLPAKASHDRGALDALLDHSRLGHFAVVRPDGTPVVIPTAIARDGDRVLVHGSTGSPWMRQLADGAPTSLAVTALEGLVIARSAFESSMHYRSAVMFGSCSVLRAADKVAALNLVTDSLIPGRAREVRASTGKELAATLVLALPITEWSLKISGGWPDDPPDDIAGSAWAGVVPMSVVYGQPLPAPDLRDGIPLPPSVLGL